MSALGDIASDRSAGRLGPRCAIALALATGFAATASLLMPTAAHAQKVSVDAGISSELTWTSNGQLGEGTAATGQRSDTILDLRPHIAIRFDGARLKLGGSASLNAITSANGTQPSRLLPQADLTARLEAIERLLFVDAGLRAVQTSENPFGALPEAGTSRNTVTTSEAHFSPTLKGEFGSQTRYQVRSDNSWTHTSGTTATTLTTGAGYFGHHSALLEHDPRPLGWRLEAERSETRYRDDSQDPLVFDLARATVNYAFGEELTAGVRAGHERTSIMTSNDRRNLYGVEGHWQPSPRTSLSAFEEKRFFGRSWQVGFDHRMPQMAWNVTLSRTLSTSPQALFNLPPTDNVAGLLDAMFTTRFPDPAERARAVQDFIARQGLPTSTFGPLNIYSQRLSLVTLRSVSVVLVGVRNSLTLTGFQSRTEDSPDAGTLANGTPATNNEQRGASALLSHRLSPTIGLNVSANWSRVQALQTSDRSIQRSLRTQLNVQTSPRTAAFVGARYREFDSNVESDGREGAVFAGFDHRF